MWYDETLIRYIKIDKKRPDEARHGVKSLIHDEALSYDSWGGVWGVGATKNLLVVMETDRL